MPAIPFIIVDGYNLLLQTTDSRRLAGPGNLARARISLVGMLAGRLPLEQQKRTTIVFDSGGGQPANDGPRPLKHEMTILFASDYENADAMIIDLLRKTSSPRQTILVSSDHEIQKVAKQRRCQIMDSLDWLDSIEIRNESDSQETMAQTRFDPVESTRNRILDEDERNYWLEEFGIPPDEEE
ncbi:MAG: NYN domain-containing protein [Pirellulaceae bacterium]